MKRPIFKVQASSFGGPGEKNGATSISRYRVYPPYGTHASAGSASVYRWYIDRALPPHVLLLLLLLPSLIPPPHRPASDLRRREERSPPIPQFSFGPGRPKAKKEGERREEEGDEQREGDHTKQQRRARVPRAIG